MASFFSTKGIFNARASGSPQSDTTYETIQTPIVHANINDGFPKVSVYFAVGFGMGIDEQTGFGMMEFGNCRYLPFKNFRAEYVDSNTLFLAIDKDFHDTYKVILHSNEGKNNKYTLQAENSELEFIVYLD